MKRVCEREGGGREADGGEGGRGVTSQREGERFIIHVCEIRIKLNRLLGIILRDFPT